MKFLLALILFIPLSYAKDTAHCNCLSLDSVLGDNGKNIEAINNSLKRDFKRRTVPIKSWNLALQIETNFEVPLVGKDIYWGRIYFKEGDNQNILFRDDLIAERNYNKEKNKPSTFNYSTYKIADINSPQGLPLIKGAGAEVSVKSEGGNFSSQTGGRLALKVKAPKEKPITLHLDVVKSGKNISKYLLINNRRIQFDSFKINASKNMITGTSILNGIDNIQFSLRGKPVHVISP